MTNKNTEYKRVFDELLSVYDHAAKQYAARFKGDAGGQGYLWGWTWWSLPPKMWRIAKALGFKRVYYSYPYDSDHWQYDHQIGDYNGSSAAQSDALEELRKKYPDSDLLKDISSGGRLD